MRDLKFISVVDNWGRFVWEVDTFLTNYRKFGYDKDTQILIFRRENEPILDGWFLLEKKFPDTQFIHYEDAHKIANTYNNLRYIPLLRIYTLKEHFLKYPELEKQAIFYTDSDIVFLKKLDFSPFLEDDTNYLSATSYIGVEYFDSKVADVKPQMLKEYQNLDILNSTASLCGINRKICEDNKAGTGGAQYLLKNITSSFWEEVFESTCGIRVYLREFINKTFFDNEDKGFQSWCADMEALLWTLWKKGMKTECPTELDFSWSTDLIDDKNYILHNAGITGDSKIRTRIKDDKGKNIEIAAPAFYKGNYANEAPDKATLNEIISNPISSTYYTSVYCKEILNSLNNNNI